MSVYIKGIGTISPQQSWGDDALLLNAYDYRGILLNCVEPEYESWLDPRQLRRMSRILKMGITAALRALRDADLEVPDGIITGTGYGCLEDTGTFLAKLVENNEEALNPTPFIQSTHNTIGSTIAMLLQCQGYNQTITHRAFSFEHALLDGLMAFDDGAVENLLIGGVDEVTPVSHAIQTRFDIFRKKQASTLNLFRPARRGTVNGEGAAFFVLSGIHDSKSLAVLEGVMTLYRPSQKKLHDSIHTFIRERGYTPADIEFVLYGKSGDRKTDQVLEDVRTGIFPRTGRGSFKHLCGEFPVASGFALWLATRMLREGNVPEVVSEKPVNRPFKNVLIVNSYFGTHYSLILLKSCRDTI
jgi:3-oxoacyl-[acyl-carrier-protein] synthase II